MVETEHGAPAGGGLEAGYVTMFSSPPDRLAALGVVAVVLAGIAVGFFVTRDRSYDHGFDTTVANPAFHDTHPVVLFDEGHENTHTTDGPYHPLAEMLRSDGFTVKVAKETFTSATLEGAAVLVIAGARGANDANDAPALTDSEAAAVEAWVAGGGSLLLVSDHWPYGAAVASLGRRFGVTMGAGFVQDEANHDPERGDSHLVFSDVNGLLRDHPIVRGRNDAERVRRVLTFTGSSVRGPEGSVAFLALAGTATERPPGPPRVDKNGGDVVVSMEYGDPVPAAGAAQGIAMEFGAGRIVVLAEAGILRAQRDRKAGNVGMNAEGYDDRQLALNVVRWLAGVLGPRSREGPSAERTNS